MRNDKVILAAILTLLSANANAARKNRASGTRVVVGNRSTTRNVNVSGTTTSISATIADTTTATPYDTGVIAPITDKQAERVCTTMVINSLKAYCDTGNGTKKCKNPTEIYAVMPYIKVTDDKNKTIADETYCANFLETAVNKLWNSYDSVATLNEENCNVALARSLAAEACYRELLASKNDERIGSSNRDTDACSTEEVQKYYTQLTGETAPSSATGNDLQRIFSNVGKTNWKTNITARIGRLADLNLSSNTDEYPRELVQLVNSLKSTGNVMCGPDRYTELYDANFTLSQTSSSLEKAVQEKGILKGAYDWGVDQLSVFGGENWSDKAKENGIFGGKNKDEKDDTSKKERKKEEKEEKEKAKNLKNLTQGEKQMRRNVLKNKKEYISDITLTEENYKTNLEDAEGKISDLINQHSDIIDTTELENCKNDINKLSSDTFETANSNWNTVKKKCEDAIQNIINAINNI